MGNDHTDRVAPLPLEADGDVTIYPEVRSKPEPAQNPYVGFLVELISADCECASYNCWPKCWPCEARLVYKK